MARGTRALRTVENQPTAHGARARWRTWRGCLRGQRGARSIPHRVPRLFITDTAPGQWLRRRNAVIEAAELRGARSARASPSRELAERPWSTRAWRTWRGCLRGQRGARSISRRWLRLIITVTATDRRLRLRSAVINASEFRAARPVRASSRGEAAIRPRSTRALADLARLSSRPTRGVFHPTPMAEALHQRHSDRSAAAASKCRSRSCRIS